VPRTLKAITGERPRCQYWGKPLRPYAGTVEVFGNLDEAPDQKALPSLGSPYLSLREGKYLIERGYQVHPAEARAACSRCPEGAQQTSPGQRPGEKRIQTNNKP